MHEHIACVNCSVEVFSSFASSLIVGSSLFLFISSSRFLDALRASSFKLLETLMLPPSLKSLLISPRITGTAYVENLTPLLTSKASYALTSPMLPAEKRSS